MYTASEGDACNWDKQGTITGGRKYAPQRRRVRERRSGPNQGTAGEDAHAVTMTIEG